MVSAGCLQTYRGRQMSIHGRRGRAPKRTAAPRGKEKVREHGPLRAGNLPHERKPQGIYRDRELGRRERNKEGGRRTSSSTWLLLSSFTGRPPMPRSQPYISARLLKPGVLLHCTCSPTSVDRLSVRLICSLPSLWSPLKPYFPPLPPFPLFFFVSLVLYYIEVTGSA